MISIIVPVYHVEEYIAKCLDSLIKQSYKDIEILCINDCTLDNSVTIINEYREKDSRIKLLNHTENKGLGGARNTGVKHANGEYIVFIDSDDYVAPTMLEKLYKSLKQYDSDVAVCGVMLTYGKDEKFIPHTAFHYDELAKKEIYNLEEDRQILTDIWPSAWNKLFKTEIIKKYKILFKERLLYEDHTFFYEYFSYCKKFSYIREPLYYYRQQRPNSITTQSCGREKEIFKILRYISELFDKMYSQEEKERLFAKIVVRLLYERRWVFNENDKNYYEYLRSVSNYLDKFDKSLLQSSKDSFIVDSDPIFLSIPEIDAYEKKVARKKRRNIQNCVKNFLKKLPLLKQTVSIRDQIRIFRNDFYWYITNIHTNLNLLVEQSNKIYSNSSQTTNLQEILRVLDHKVEKVEQELKDIVQTNQLQDSLKVLDDRIEEIKQELKNITQTQGVEKEFLKESVYNLEKMISTYEKKNNDIWWLAWYIKNHLHSNEKIMGTTSDPLLRYYPTWIPSEYPEYFKGNTWWWSDNFKQYYIEHYMQCTEEFNNLCRGLTEMDIEYLKILWERNIKMIPYADYTDKQAFLMKRDIVFTASELSEQKEICRLYTSIISKYLLPEGTTYEIPVFYYKHGLTMLSKQYLDFVRNGDILDLGGFIGDSALVLKDYTSKVVYSIEMNKDNINTMKTVLEKNNVDENKVKMVWGAVGCQDSMNFYYGEGSSSSLVKSENKKHGELAIKVYTIDTLVTKYGVNPHFIKMDVEGTEYDAVLGAEKTIREYKPVLCISIYHTAKDFLLIKPLIESWKLGYSFRVENHNPFDPVYEKMLICIPKITNEVQ